MSYAWVERYLNLPYADRGRTLDGIDCWGLVRLILVNEFGKKNVPVLDGYTSASDAGDYISQNWNAWQTVWERKKSLDIPHGEEPGDVLVFNIRGRPIHVGIVVREGLGLHILENQPSCRVEYRYQPFNRMLERVSRWVS